MEQKLSKIDPKISDIPDNFCINDYRKLSDFKKQTFSGYQKSDVLNALQKSIIDNKVEEACHWCAEMLISGHVFECWDRLIMINAKLINAANPNFPYYLWSRFVQQIQIFQEERYQGDKVLQLRNNQECRNHLSDIVTVMTLSPKNKLKSLPKITTEDFRLDFFETKLEAKSINLLENIIKPNDPSEIGIVANEFAFHLTSRTGNLDKALYWLTWILEWEKINIKKGDSFNCAARNRKHIKPQYYHDVIWLVWDVIFQEASHRNDEHLNKQLIGIFKLFKYNFTSPSKKKKSPLIIHGLYLLSYQSKIHWGAMVCVKNKIHIQAIANVNVLYLEYRNKSKNNYQQKEESLQLMSRNNYLVSDQKVESVKKSTQGKKEKIADVDQYKMNILEMMDRKNMYTSNSSGSGSGSSNQVPNQNYNRMLNPISINHTTSQASHNSSKIPYKATENVINHINTFI
jgi:hypothetical protein